MKNLLFVFAISAAVSAQAASFTWKNSNNSPGTAVFQSDGKTGVAEGTIAYLFSTTDKSQADLLAAVRGGESLETYAISGANGTVNGDHKIPETSPFDYGSDGNDYSFYYALISGNEILISTEVERQGQQSATVLIAFTGSGGDSGWSKNSYGDAVFSEAGWYSLSGAVPEPFSGSLILLGLGAMALRRRRRR